MTLNGACACGMDYVRGHEDHEARHARVHEEHANGKPMPAAVVSLPTAAVVALGEYRLIWIDLTVPIDVRWQVAHVAYIECRESGRPVCYDGPETAERPRLLVAL